jgi:hypothetical protein
VDSPRPFVDATGPEPVTVPAPVHPDFGV